VSWNIVGIRSVKDAYDPLYPSIGGKGDTLVTYGVIDGLNIARFPFLSAYIYAESTKNKIGAFTEGVGTIFLTDSRVALLNHSFKTANTNDLLWDLQGEYIGSALLAKARTHNRALVGHIPHLCLQSVSVHVSEKRGVFPTLSFEVRDGTSTPPPGVAHRLARGCP
jgi:hypothetical protein